MKEQDFQTHLLKNIDKPLHNSLAMYFQNNRFPNLLKNLIYINLMGELRRDLSNQIANNV